MAARARLVLVRHGESQWNASGIVQGQDGPGLTERGHDQAAALAQRRADEAPSAALATSDLDRCCETIAPLERLLGRDATPDERLRERHFGRWQGLRHDELAAQDPEIHARWRQHEDVYDELGGESDEVRRARVLTALRELAAAAPVTIVSTHGGPVWHAAHALVGLPVPSLGRPANAGVTVLDLDGDDVRLVTWNEVGHLPSRQRTTWLASDEVVAAAR